MNEVFTYCTDVDLDKPVGAPRLYHQLAEFVVDKCRQAGMRIDSLKLQRPRPDWASVGLGSVTTDDSKFLVHFKCCPEALHLESYDSEIKHIEFSFRNNHDKMTCTLQVSRHGQVVFEGNLLQMFTQAQLMKATDQIISLQMKSEQVGTRSKTSAPCSSSFPGESQSSSSLNSMHSKHRGLSSQGGQCSEAVSDPVSPHKANVSIAAEASTPAQALPTTPHAEIDTPEKAAQTQDDAPIKKSRTAQSPGGGNAPSPKKACAKTQAAKATLKVKDEPGQKKLTESFFKPKRG
jgi:hypothetical protein